MALLGLKDLLPLHFGYNHIARNVEIDFRHGSRCPYIVPLDIVKYMSRVGDVTV